MRFAETLVPGRLLQRLNRFVVLVEVAGRPELAHLANSGRLRELMVPNAAVHLAPRPARRGRTRYDLALVDLGGILVSADARLPGALFAEAVEQGIVPLLQGSTALQQEVYWGDSRLDLLVEHGGDRWLIETKSITLVEQCTALFPDAPTERGRRHLRTLVAATAQGYRAAVVFVVQRADAVRFRPHDQADPLFGHELRAAAAAGVEVWAYRCRVSTEEVGVTEAIAVDLGS
ncbi:MAG: DNA/RNA nuclease SfsA [Chloroflexi bacterium]|nr:DNA/RNA nuclease SfsA [Chloroflexota bacterium]